MVLPLSVFAEDGMRNVLGTDHDVPSALDCWSCHKGQPGSVLGFSALQLAHEGPGALDAIVRAGLLTDPPPDLDPRPPGDPETSRALGYLHANCGHCHNPRGGAWPDTASHG